MHDREASWGKAEHQAFDVLVIGGGINGTCLFDHLNRQGYKVLLVDRNDFASGTSQASGMMVWGGLLYLRNLDLPTVFRLSCDRDAMIRELKDHISPKLYRYIPSIRGNLNPELVRAALSFYWIMSLFRRKPPRCEKSFEETCLLKPGVHRGSFLYEEAVLNTSDCRFTFDWLTFTPSTHSVALNYCSATGEYSQADQWWHLALKDTLGGRETSLRAKLIVNCAGVWTDQVNNQFGIETPFKHVLSKGVYIGVKRPAGHHSLMIFEMGDHGDVLTFVPWGPISLWGPTETFPQDIHDGMTVAAEDVRFLLDRVNGHLKPGFDKSQILSMRCGIRPLAVKKEFMQAHYPLDLSRRQHVVPDNDLPWVSSYGGKITGCREMANKICRVVARKVRPAYSPAALRDEDPQCSVEWISWPGMEEKVPSPAWCARHELCCTLEDYLRRRTNIAQWVPRQGLGRDNEHLKILADAAAQISGLTQAESLTRMQQYKTDVEERFDRVLERV